MKKFEEIYTKSLKEMKLHKGFVMSPSFIIKTDNDFLDIFELLQDEIEKISENIRELFHYESLQRDPLFSVIKESQQDNIKRYNKAFNDIQKSFSLVSDLCSKIELYLQQEKYPSKMFSLQERNNYVREQIEFVDKRIKSYQFYSKKELLPEIDDVIKLFYEIIEKYNQYIDIINQRNKWAYENIKNCKNVNLEIIEKIENLKNWSFE